MKKHITNKKSKNLIFLFIFCCISFLFNYLYSNKNIIYEGFKSCPIPKSPLPSKNSKSSVKINKIKKQKNSTHKNKVTYALPDSLVK